MPIATEAEDSAPRRSARPRRPVDKHDSGATSDANQSNKQASLKRKASTTDIETASRRKSSQRAKADHDSESMEGSEASDDVQEEDSELDEDSEASQSEREDAADEDYQRQVAKFQRSTGKTKSTQQKRKDVSKPQRRTKEPARTKKAAKGPKDPNVPAAVQERMNAAPTSATRQGGVKKVARAGRQDEVKITDDSELFSQLVPSILWTMTLINPSNSKTPSKTRILRLTTLHRIGCNYIKTRMKSNSKSLNHCHS